jgi:hypothetical protein
MKKLIFILLFAICFCTLKAQKYDSGFPVDKFGKIIYTEVVNMDSVKKDELFLRAKSCFVKLFKDANRVIQNEDKENGSITGKGLIEIHLKAVGLVVPGGWVNFILNISVKDGKYKYNISDLRHEGNGSNIPSGGNLENGKPKGWVTKQWNSIIIQTNDELKDLIRSIKDEMNNPSTKLNSW